MLFGHNSNVVIGSDTVHVQTEDRGAKSAIIDTTVHWKGRVLHRRTSKYEDLLPLDHDKEAALKTRLDDQHRTVIEEIRSGALQFTLPPLAAPPAAIAAPVTAAPPSTVYAALKIELTNARTWLAGKHATLQLAVKDAAGTVVAGANALARVEGADGSPQFQSTTDANGSATLQFEMPKLTAAEASLVIEAAHNGAKGHLRFQLRAKPKA
jgi:hypothetical protein